MDTNASKVPVPDRKALLLMLTYVEAECRRLGAEAAAEHAAMAAALMRPGTLPKPAAARRGH